MPFDRFHPATREWFRRQFSTATPVQEQAWRAIAAGEHTLIAAPTGSGKTLAAFYAVIDALVREADSGGLGNATRVLYVSPLKALSNDIQRNLQQPLAGIADELLMQGRPPVDIRVGLRTGDTPAGERQRMARHPPHIMVTTPESLYLLLTSDSGRRMLGDVDTVIVDEIHAMLADKRGSHLALSLERLQQLVTGPLQRIGLSATQKPVSEVARYLLGSRGGEADEEPPCAIIDAGHQRAMDLRLAVPDSPLSALMSGEVWEELYEQLVGLIEAHRTTLVFVNTRRLSERLALALRERLGDGAVSSHHGSMSRDHRHAAEQSLKAGELRVLVATASMELGIDVGSVDLVVQFASPKGIATFLQRAGRSGHSLGARPQGILFPLTRDDLVECTAMLDAIERGELDRLQMPECPLDILAQQLVAEVAGREVEGPLALEALYQQFRGAWPYRSLDRKRFDEVVTMLAEGYSTRRGRRGAWLHLDRINGRVAARRGARLTALTNGGAIPDMFDYQVVLDPEDTVVGTLNEDFALETLPGDIFTLGTHSWQLIRVDGLKVRVRDAQGMPPSVPFWFGEGPGRTEELSRAVSRLRTQIEKRLLDEDRAGASRWLTATLGLPSSAAEQLLDYLEAGWRALQCMPTRQRLIMERFFDEVGDMHLVIHAPFGSRINRAWGLALRKRFCRSFNFELQAAANEDAIVISLGAVHSFDLEQVFAYLKSASVADVLVQALLDTPMFETRWRWNASRSLAIQRNRGGRRVPPQFQRMDAEDLVAQVFPDQLACQENLGGRREVPDHPLVQQTLHDCLSEAMDLDGLKAILAAIESGACELVARDLREPSPFAGEIINASPYAFLDDAPFEERRTNAVRHRSWLDPAEAGDFSALDANAIERVREQAWPLIRGPEELHDALYSLGFMTDAEVERAGARHWLDELAAQGRVTRWRQADRDLHVSAERLACIRAAMPAGWAEPELSLPAALDQPWTGEAACREVIRARLEASGPIDAARLSADSGLSGQAVETALQALESEGFVLRGHFEHADGPLQWCERRLLQRIHRYTMDAYREAVRPVSLQAWVRFVFERNEIRPQALEPRPQAMPSPAEGQALLERSVERLDGTAAPAASWESDIFSARLPFYDPSWLDGLCLSGRVVWGRYSPPATVTAVRKGRQPRPAPVRTTPITLALREHSPLWRSLSARAEADGIALGSAARTVADDLERHGASFFSDIHQRCGLLPGQLEEALAELVAGGWLSSDSFTGLRALLTPASRRRRGRRGRRPAYSVEEAGRWFLLPAVGDGEADDAELETLARACLRRWGVLFRGVIERETAQVPWRVMLRVLRRMELRGELRGGRFIAGVGGEQFAAAETVTALRDKARELDGERDYRDAEYHSLCAADPVNPLPLIDPAQRLARQGGNRVLFKDGVPIAVQEGGRQHFLREVPGEHEWALLQLLQRRDPPPQVRAYAR